MNTALFGEPSVLIRLAIATGLAGLALALFLTQESRVPHPPETLHRTGEELAVMLPQLDREIDTVLASFGVETRWIRKRSIPRDGQPLPVIERRVMLPADIVPLRINAGLTGIARRYHARTTAGEDSKSRTVTIRIEMDGIVYQTLMLKTVPDLRKAASGRKKGTADAGYNDSHLFFPLTTS